MFLREPVRESGMPLTGADVAGWGDVYAAAVGAQRAIDNAGARQALLLDAFDRRSDDVFAATGVRLPNPHRSQPTADQWREIAERGRTRGAVFVPDFLAERFQASLADLEVQHPDKADRIRAAVSPRDDALAKRNRAEQDLAGTMERAGGSVSLPLLGAVHPAAIAGSVVGSFYDPANALANLIGPAGQAGRSVIWNAMRQAAASGVSQAALEPFVQSWRAEASKSVDALEHGFGAAARNVLLATTVGGSLDAAGRAAGRAYLGRPLSGAPTELAEAALDATARALPPGELVRQAADGDVKALTRLARSSDDPALRGAAASLEADEAMAAAARRDAPRIPAAEVARRLRQGQLHLEDPEAHPPPGRPIELARARGPRLADDAMAALADGETIQMAGKPARIAALPAAELTRDAGAYQWKTAGADGVDGSLGGARFDSERAGLLVVHERADGRRIVADGHQRHDLALRTAPDESLRALVLREADGWTVDAVRDAAALKNLQEGSGTALDAARLIRSSPTAVDGSISLEPEAMQAAFAFARLSDDAWLRLTSGAANPEHAALVGDHVADPLRHGPLLERLVGAPDRDAARRELAAALAETPAAPAPRDAVWQLDDPFGADAAKQIDALKRDAKGVGAQLVFPEIKAELEKAGRFGELAEIVATCKA